MIKGLMFAIIGMSFLACTSSPKVVLNPNCLELDKKLAELKNEKKFNSTALLTKISLTNKVSMVNEHSLDKAIRLSEAELNECNE